MFLDDMKEIPKGMNFELHLDVGGIKQKPLIGCLKKYIEDVKVKGRLGLYFLNVQAEDKPAFGEILNIMREKGCFELFRMAMESLRPLFYVRKGNILDVADDLISN